MRVWKKNFRRLTPEQVDRVRALPWEAGSITRLAKEFGVSPTAIWNIRHGRTYKRPWLAKTYAARVTDHRERYNLGTFRTPEEAQHAIDRFKRTNKWPRGSVEKAKGRFRARLSLGIYDTRHAAEWACSKALEVLYRDPVTRPLAEIGKVKRGKPGVEPEGGSSAPRPSLITAMNSRPLTR
jgi:hypothetical protein